MDLGPRRGVQRAAARRDRRPARAGGARWSRSTAACAQHGKGSRVSRVLGVHRCRPRRRGRRARQRRPGPNRRHDQFRAAEPAPGTRDGHRRLCRRGRRRSRSRPVGEAGDRRSPGEPRTDAPHPDPRDRHPPGVEPGRCRRRDDRGPRRHSPGGSGALCGTARCVRRSDGGVAPRSRAGAAGPTPRRLDAALRVPLGRHAVWAHRPGAPDHGGDRDDRRRPPAGPERLPPRTALHRHPQTPHPPPPSPPARFCCTSPPVLFRRSAENSAVLRNRTGFWGRGSVVAEKSWESSRLLRHRYVNSDVRR